jgi:phosphoenolpyruvate synthase/pyruvate phosphate dikinase
MGRTRRPVRRKCWSLVAYGIPAVGGCGDATARLRTGMRVTVDGGTGNVEPE